MKGTLLQDFLISPDAQAILRQLEIRAPNRLGFENITIPGEQSPTHHINVRQTYQTSPSEYYLDNHLGAALGARKNSAAAEGEAVQLIINSSAVRPQHVETLDGTFDEVGELIREIQEALAAAPPDDLIARRVESLFDLESMASAVWDMKGSAKLVTLDGNHMAQLAQADGTQISQQLITDHGFKSLHFDLAIEVAGAEDRLEVLLNDEIVGIFDLVALLESARLAALPYVPRPF